MPTEDEAPCLLWSSVIIFLWLKSGSYPCLALGCCMTFAPSHAFLPTPARLSVSASSAPPLSCCFSHSPLAKQIECTGVHRIHCEKQRLFLLGLSHQTGLVAKCSSGATQYGYLYGPLWLAVMSGPENMRTRFLLWCLWIYGWIIRQQCPSDVLHRSLQKLGKQGSGMGELLCGIWFYQRIFHS